MTKSRLESLGRELGERESSRSRARERARYLAEALRAEALGMVRRFTAAASASGAPHLDLIAVGPVEPDDKSVRAFQFVIRRGRHIAIVVSKDRGDVMLVGPFKRGGEEGPCGPVPLEPDEAVSPRLVAALESLMERLIEVAFRK